MYGLPNRLLRSLSLLSASILLTLPVHASGKSIWAKGATRLDLNCSGRVSPILSPDRRSSVWVKCDERTGEYPAYSLRTQMGRSRAYDLPLPEGAQELLWAPNSKAFFVNGSESGYAGDFVKLYELTTRGPEEHIVTDLAQKDMVASFPPCKAAYRDETTCAGISQDPEYNMSGVAWSNDSHSIFVFAEVPCSSLYGGIMCQVMGYELDISNGNILERLTAPQVKAHWRGVLAWNMHIPDPPVYGKR